MPLPTRSDQLLEVLERVLDKGIIVDAFVIGEVGIDMRRVRVLPPNGDGDDGGGEGGAAAQMRPPQHDRLRVVSPAYRLAKP